MAKLEKYGLTSVNRTDYKPLHGHAYAHGTELVFKKPINLHELKSVSDALGYKMKIERIDDSVYEESKNSKASKTTEPYEYLYGTATIYKEVPKTFLKFLRKYTQNADVAYINGNTAFFEYGERNLMNEYGKKAFNWDLSNEELKLITEFLYWGSELNTSEESNPASK